MMSTLWSFLNLGFRHIVALDAADHILFLLALAAIYRGRDWRAVLWVVTAFTVGHSLTLALAVLDAVRLPSRWIEFLIPVTIIATCAENLVSRERLAGTRYRPVLAAAFGLVHGAGFAGYLRGLFVDHIAMPLLGFNIGIELGQIVVLCAAFALFRACDVAFRAPAARLQRTPLQMRLIAISAVVSVVATGWAVERWPL
jgi:hypothetical protein